MELQDLKIGDEFKFYTNKQGFSIEVGKLKITKADFRYDSENTTDKKSYLSGYFAQVTEGIDKGACFYVRNTYDGKCIICHENIESDIVRCVKRPYEYVLNPNKEYTVYDKILHKKSIGEMFVEIDYRSYGKPRIGKVLEVKYTDNNLFYCKEVGENTLETDVFDEYGINQTYNKKNVRLVSMPQKQDIFDIEKEYKAEIAFVDGVIKIKLDRYSYKIPYGETKFDLW